MYTYAHTHKHWAHHQQSHYVVDSSSPCRQCYLPSVSEKGEMGNETDVCKGAFWVICLIRGLMGSEGIKRLKQRFSFLSPSPTLHLFPALLSVQKCQETVAVSFSFPSCLVLICDSNPHHDCVIMVHIPIQSVKQKYAFLRGHLPPMTFYSLIRSFWPLNSTTWSPEGVEVSSTGGFRWQTGVASWHQPNLYSFMSAHKGLQHCLHAHTHPRIFAACFLD